MRLVSLLAMLVATLIACSSQTPQKPQPPTGFPDLSKFTAVDPAHYTIAGGAFVSPDQVSCALDEGDGSIVCSGNIRGLPNSITGAGCPVVRKPNGSPADTKYVIDREEPDCTSSRWTPIAVGQKLTEEIGTCAVGEGGLIACIDSDNKHGFVLQPSGSWTF
jgi:hypothetical protein